MGTTGKNKGKRYFIEEEEEEEFSVIFRENKLFETSQEPTLFA